MNTFEFRISQGSDWLHRHITGCISKGKIAKVGHVPVVGHSEVRLNGPKKGLIGTGVRKRSEGSGKSEQEDKAEGDPVRTAGKALLSPLHDRSEVP